MNSIERFTDVVVEECANLNELKIDSENFIVFFQIVPAHSVPYFFKPGFNYMVVRDDLADVEDIINMCLERPELSEIAQNGKNTYLKYFSTTKGCLPFITIGAILKELNHKIGKQFFRYTLKYNC